MKSAIKGQGNNSKGCAILDLGRIGDVGQTREQWRSGKTTSVKGEDGPRETPRHETGLAASLEPCEARSREFVGRLTPKGEECEGSCIEVRRHWLPVDDSISCVPASVGTGSVEQHFDAPLDPEAKKLRLRRAREILQRQQGI